MQLQPGSADLLFVGRFFESLIIFLLIYGYYAAIAYHTVSIDIETYHADYTRLALILIVTFVI